MLVVEFAAIFFFILIFGYLLPAGQYYYRFHVRRGPWTDALRLQPRVPTRAQIAREIRLSLSTIAIFAFLGTLLFQVYKAGGTSIYVNFRDYPLWYLPVSVMLCLVLLDTYFYWTHRVMHWRPIFKYIHLGHHRSVSPTPWAIFAFQPAEAIVQFCGIMLLVLFVPLHPLALMAFLWIDTQVNCAGHTGYEIVPKFISGLRIFRGFNTVTHHDMHHTHMGKNFGAFFNLWDRLMGTYLSDETHRNFTKEDFPDDADVATQENAPAAGRENVGQPRSPGETRPATKPALPGQGRITAPSTSAR